MNLFHIKLTHVHVWYFQMSEVSSGVIRLTSDPPPHPPFTLNFLSIHPTQHTPTHTPFPLIVQGRQGHLPCSLHPQAPY